MIDAERVMQQECKIGIQEKKDGLKNRGMRTLHSVKSGDSGIGTRVKYRCQSELQKQKTWKE